MPFLIERLTGAQPVVTRIEDDSLLIGRGTNAGLRLDDPSVALEHARIERVRGDYKLTDLESLTGTYLNGKKVQEALLSDGDMIDVGSSRLRVRWSAPADPLTLEMRPITAPAAEIATSVPVRDVDYLRAYRLRRPFLTKGFLAVLLTLAAAGALAALPRFGIWRAFEPGPISEAHQRKDVGCFGCHAPWKGPTTVNCSSECHPRADHQPRQAFTPDCSSCHFEHRGRDLVKQVSDGSCVACHGSLQVKGNSKPAFARTITAFPEGHADFSVTVSGAGRLPLAEAVARQVDPGTVRLNHALHLKPGLIGPEGRETLTCASCHEPGSGSTGMKPVSYEQHCNRCHRLTFDDARPDDEAPHEEPRAVRDRLVAAYGLNEGRMGSFRERRRNVIRNPEATMGVTLSSRVLAQVAEAEAHLYRSACAKCHEMDLRAKPYPTVARSRLQSEWLPLSHFDHQQHLETEIRGLMCETCHVRAAGSTATADVLVPGIEACGGCHGGSGKPPGNAALKTGRNECTDCHAYHPRKEERKG
jgi:hypothetical protein